MIKLGGIDPGSTFNAPTASAFLSAQFPPFASLPYVQNCRALPQLPGPIVLAVFHPAIVGPEFLRTATAGYTQRQEFSLPVHRAKNATTFAPTISVNRPLPESPEFLRIDPYVFFSRSRAKNSTCLPPSTHGHHAWRIFVSKPPEVMRLSGTKTIFHQPQAASPTP
jgi:hypothetical protein